MDVADRLAQVLQRCNRTPEEVLWVGTSGTSGFRQTWAELENNQPRGIDYARFDRDWVIVGDTWWISYDGDSYGDYGWEYHQHPVFPISPRPFTLDLQGNITDLPRQGG